MASKQDRGRVTPDGAGQSVDHDGAGSSDDVGSHRPRLVVSWLIVGLPLAYGIYQTISKTVPLFGGG